MNGAPSLSRDGVRQGLLRRQTATSTTLAQPGTRAAEWPGRLARKYMVYYSERLHVGVCHACGPTRAARRHRAGAAGPPGSGRTAKATAALALNFTTGRNSAAFSATSWQSPVPSGSSPYSGATDATVIARRGLPTRPIRPNPSSRTTRKGIALTGTNGATKFHSRRLVHPRRPQHVGRWPHHHPR